jgi:protein TonB
VLVLSLGLAACSEDPPPATTATPPPSATTPTDAPAAPSDAAAAPDAVPVDPNETEEQINTRAAAAVQEQRLFAPPGDNAFELYVRVAEGNAEHTFARNALTDLFPYAVMHVEQRLAARDLPDAARVLALMERANPQAPALPRLRRELEGLQARAEAEEIARLAREERAAQEAASAAAATPPPTEAAEPEPEPAPAVATPTPAPVQTAPAPVATPPAPVETAPAPATPRAAGGLPRVVRMSQPRYPPLALRRSIEGFVEVSFTVQPDGSVTNVEVVRAEPSNVFNREAINAMEKWVFEASGTTSQGRRTFDFKLAAD